MRRTALILGGGPAGAAAAVTLARGGAAPVVLERSRAPTDPLCGGFVSWRTLERLAALGIAADALNPARIDRVRVFAGTRMIEAPLPRPALAVSRRRLDRLLLAQAARLGAGVERGVTVRALEDDGVRTGDGATLTADALLLATGKHDVRGIGRGPDPNPVPVIGLRARCTPSPAMAARLAGVIELHPFPGGYAGVVLQEDGSVNVCLATERKRLTAAGGPAALLDDLARQLPLLGERMARRDSAAIDAVANVPYGWRATSGRAGLFRLGDQAAVIPSLAGEGIGIALATGISAAGALLRDGPAIAASWQQATARRAARPLVVAGMVRTLVERPATWMLAAPLLRAAPAVLRALAAATRMPHDRDEEVAQRNLLSPA